MDKLRRILALATALCALFTAPVMAAEPEQAKAAIAAFEAVTANPPAHELGFPFAGYFYLDFDQNGIPELVMVYGPEVDWMTPCGMAVVVWYYDGGAQKVTGGYPDAMIGDYIGMSLSSSIGASGGTLASVIRYPNGTYGLCSRDLNDPSSELRCAYSGNRFVPMDTQGTVVYELMDIQPIPDLYQHFDRPADSGPVAYASTQTVLLNGKSVEFQAYALKDEKGNDTNYVKLRDLAYILNGTSAQFAVEWDGAVSVLTRQPYTPNGSEMTTPFSGNQLYSRPTAETWVDGWATELDAIVLTDASGGAYTYYKLRDLGEALGFLVDWSDRVGITIATP